MSKLLSPLRWCLALVLIAALAAPARARTSESDKAKARKLVTTAKRLLKKQKLEQALRFFEQAYRYWPRPEIQFNICLVHLGMGNKLKAAIHLRSYLKKTRVDRARLPLPLRKVLTETAVLQIKAPAADVAIWVDGRLEGMGTAEVVVLPGKRPVEFRKGGKVLLKTVLDATGGQVVVYSPTPVTPRRPPPGGTPVPTTGGKKLHWAYFAGAAGLAVLASAVMIGTGVKTLELHDRFESNPDDTDAQSQGKALKAATNALVGIASVAAVSAAVLAFFTRWRQPERSSAVNVQPSVGPGGASVTVAVEF